MLWLLGVGCVKGTKKNERKKRKQVLVVFELQLFRLGLVIKGVKVGPLLLGDREGVAEAGDLIEINLGVNNPLLFIRGGKNLSPGINNGGVAPSDISSGLISGRGAGSHEKLVIHRPCPLEKLPVSWPGGHVEGAGEEDHLAATLRHQHRQLGEADVVADGKANPSEFWFVWFGFGF